MPAPQKGSRIIICRSNREGFGRLIHLLGLMELQAENEPLKAAPTHQLSYPKPDAKQRGQQQNEHQVKHDYPPLYWSGPVRTPIAQLRRWFARFLAQI
jgi:hypothetical protein